MVDFCDDGDRNTMDKGILISPVPKEYAFYTDNEKIEKTEAYYRKMDDIYGRVDTFEEAYKNRIEQLLQNEGKAADLTNVLKEKDAQLLCYCSYEFDIIRILCRIAEQEEIFKEPSVLRNVHTMEEAVSWRHKCVFLLRRFEFDWEETDELLMLVRERKISYICLAEMICENWIVQKVHVVDRIVRYLYENDQKREAMLLLMRLEKILPYSEKKVITFAMTLVDMGEFQLAHEVLLKFKNPNEDIKELQIELSKLF